MTSNEFPSMPTVFVHYFYSFRAQIYLENSTVFFFFVEAQPGNSRQQSKAEKAKKELEALGRLTTAIPMVDDDHLDLSLDQEEIFLNQYKSLLKRD